MGVKRSLIDEAFFHAPNQWIRRLGDIEGDTAGLRPGQPDMLGQILENNLDLPGIGADQITSETYTSGSASLSIFSHQ